MRGLTDSDVRRNVQRCFVRHWVNTAKLQFFVRRGKVLVRGELERLKISAPPITPSFVQTLVAEASAAVGVKQLTLHLENWVCSDGVWVKVDDRDRRRTGQYRQHDARGQ